MAVCGVSAVAAAQVPSRAGSFHCVSLHPFSCLMVPASSACQTTLPQALTTPQFAIAATLSNVPLLFSQIDAMVNHAMHIRVIHDFASAIGRSPFRECALA
jgi:hypothetical protein